MSRPLVTALQGATVLVQDPDRAASALGSILGFRRHAAGRLPGAGRCVTLAAPGSERGMIRFLEGPEGAPVEDLREGWASVELVVRDVDALAGRLAGSQDFKLRTPPLTFDLTEQGSNVHRATLAWGPGGVLMAFTMALTQPRGRRFAEAAADVGPVFSVGLRTPDLECTSGFYRRALGMETLLEVSWRSGQWHRLFGVPEGEEAALRLLKGEGAGTGLGTIEVQSFPPALLRPPAAPGIAWVTYRTLDAAAAGAAAEAVAEVVDAGPGWFVIAGDLGERLEVTEAAW
jgi:catechol 2,3-dioxygenase-like lactoylglutathione lyase family enzyme